MKWIEFIGMDQYHLDRQSAVEDYKLQQINMITGNYEILITISDLEKYLKIKFDITKKMITYP